MKKQTFPIRRRSVYPVKSVDPRFHTQKQFVKDCDPNEIYKNATRGIAPRFAPRGTPHYGDFTDMPSLEQAHELLQNAQEAFINLPAALRDELGNDYTRIHEVSEEQARRYNLIQTLPPPGSNPPSQPTPDQASAGGQPALKGDQK